LSRINWSGQPFLEKIALLSLMKFNETQLNKLRQVSPLLEVYQLVGAEVFGIENLLREKIQVLYGWSPTVTQAQHFPALRWLQTHSAGIDYLLDTPTWHSDTLITSMNGIHATPIAEHAMAMMLAFRWRMAKMFAVKQKGTWPKERWRLFSGSELRGRTLGIVGYGAIGREVGRLAQAFGMRILAVNRSGKRQPDRGYRETGTGDPEATIPEAVYPVSALTEVLPACDYVVSVAPLTPETHHLFDATTLRQMKPGAVLINQGRGALIDEVALIDALEHNHLGGAALDVFETEPLPDSSPLWRLDNVLISPHVSGFSELYDERASNLFAENLRRYLTGEPLINLVDRERGY
jgi:phosphoglycerate dehydrogenase-like enzyme